MKLATARPDQFLEPIILSKQWIKVGAGGMIIGYVLWSQDLFHDHKTCRMLRGHVLWSKTCPMTIGHVVWHRTSPTIIVSKQALDVLTVIACFLKRWRTWSILAQISRVIGIAVAFCPHPRWGWGNKNLFFTKIVQNHIACKNSWTN